ncbi:hypothetical protein KBW98_12130 [Massilia sp. ST3]|nr:hypothetical protein [Massilia sp. ST3]
MGAASANQYLVFSTGHEPVQGRACPERRISMTEHATEEDARTAAKQLRAQTQLTDLNIDLLPPGRYSIVYSYLGKSAMYERCQFTKYATVTGDDEADARRRLAAQVAEFRSAFLGEPEVLRTWTGGYLRRTSQTVDGVEIRYRMSGTGDAATVHAQVLNRRTDKTALVGFHVNGAMQPRVVDLAPGQSANIPLGRNVREFGSAVQLVEPDTSAPGPREVLMKMLRDAVREHVEVKRIPSPSGNGTTPVFGVRG